MGQDPGHFAGPMLWLVPRYAETPGSIMRLGSILKDPADLESSLNLHDIPAIPDIHRRNASPALRRYLRAELSKADSILVNTAPSIPALFGTNIGASAKDGRHRDAATTINALNVRATVFIPTKAYMETALGDERVRKYAREGLFGKPLYIVVGVATARRLSARETREAGHHAATRAVAAAAGGQGEAAFEHHRAAGTEAELEVGEDCDFAYRVREFFYSKMRGRLVDRGNVTESALFAGDSGRPAAGSGDDGVLEIPKFEWLEDEDAAAAGLVTIAVGDDE